jgi:hypothetical protein
VRGCRRLAVDRFAQPDSYVGGRVLAIMVRHAGHDPAPSQTMSLRVARLAGRGGDDCGREDEALKGEEGECQA